MNDKNLTLEELRLLKELVNNLDEERNVFKLSKDMIEINEKKLMKEKNEREGEK